MPLEGLPQILQKISWYLPLTAAVQAVRGVMARGWNISHSSIYSAIGITKTWISILMTLAVFFCDSFDPCYDPCHVIKHES